MQNEVKHTLFFSQPPHQVWDYLTRPELIAQWLGETDFKPIEGYRFRFFSPYGNDCYGEVLEIKPFTKLSYSWQKKSSINNKPFTSTVVWTLVATDGGTALHLVHDGFSFTEDALAHGTGWNTCLTMLEELLKTN